jgi:hypothetical protein
MMREAQESLLQQEIKVVNVGLELFADALRDQEAEVAHVKWHPPADGDAELMAMLDQVL